MNANWAPICLPFLDKSVHHLLIPSVSFPSLHPPEYLPLLSPSCLFPRNGVQFNSHLDTRRLRVPITRLPEVVCKEQAVVPSKHSGHFC